jgi:hypothetical protein
LIISDLNILTIDEIFKKYQEDYQKESIEEENHIYLLFSLLNLLFSNKDKFLESEKKLFFIENLQVFFKITCDIITKEQNIHLSICNNIIFDIIFLEDFEIDEKILKEIFKVKINFNTINSYYFDNHSFLEALEKLKSCDNKKAFNIFKIYIENIFKAIKNVDKEQRVEIDKFPSQKIYNDDAPLLYLLEDILPIQFLKENVKEQNSVFELLLQKIDILNKQNNLEKIQIPFFEKLAIILATKLQNKERAKEFLINKKYFDIQFSTVDNTTYYNLLQESKDFLNKDEKETIFNQIKAFIEQSLIKDKEYCSTEYCQNKDYLRRLLEEKKLSKYFILKGLFDLFDPDLKKEYEDLEKLCKEKYNFTPEDTFREEKKYYHSTLINSNQEYKTELKEKINNFDDIQSQIILFEKDYYSVKQKNDHYKKAVENIDFYQHDFNPKERPLLKNLADICIEKNIFFNEIDKILDYLNCSKLNNFIAECLILITKKNKLDLIFNKFDKILTLAQNLIDKLSEATNKSDNLSPYQNENYSNLANFFLNLINQKELQTNVIKEQKKIKILILKILQNSINYSSQDTIIPVQDDDSDFTRNNISCISLDAIINLLKVIDKESEVKKEIVNFLKELINIIHKTKNPNLYGFLYIITKNYTFLRDSKNLQGLQLNEEDTKKLFDDNKFFEIAFSGYIENTYPNKDLYYDLIHYYTKIIAAIASKDCKYKNFSDLFSNRLSQHLFYLFINDILNHKEDENLKIIFKNRKIGEKFFQKLSDFCTKQLRSLRQDKEELEKLEDRILALYQEVYSKENENYCHPRYIFETYSQNAFEREENIRKLLKIISDIIRNKKYCYINKHFIKAIERDIDRFPETKEVIIEYFKNYAYNDFSQKDLILRPNIFKNWNKQDLKKLNLSIRDRKKIREIAGQ